MYNLKRSENKDIKEKHSKFISEARKILKRKLLGCYANYFNKKSDKSLFVPITKLYDLLIESLKK